MKCRQCGALNSAERVECSECGAPLLEALQDSVERLSPVLAPTLSGSRPADATAAPAAPTVPMLPVAPTVQLPLPASTSAPTEVPAPTAARAGATDGSSEGGVQATEVIHGGAAPALASGTAPGTETRTLGAGAVFANRYEILALLGQGGMGCVYAARDRELDRVIALKTIRGTEDAVAVQRFKQELLLARKITHKNVVRIHDLGEAEGIKFFTMEHIEGESLKDLIRHRGRLPAAEALPLVRQLLGALEEAHAQGVVHRDLKPQNVMVDKAGVPYLMDFGIARASDATGVTGTGMLIGTPDYMSPEQVKGVRADARSDLFSFGVILYEMLTGELPYQADSPLSKIVMRLSHKPRPPHELSADIPPYFEAMVLKCMEVDPALRYQTAAEIRADLDREQVDRSLTLRVARTVSRNRGVLAAGVALALAAAGGLHWAGQRRSGAAAGTQPQGPVRTLAIVPFTNATGSADLEWMSAGLPEMLVTDLSQSRFVRPVPGDRVHSVLKEAGLDKQSRFDEKALEEVARLSRAQSVLSGQFVESGPTLRLDLVLRKAGSGVPVPLKIEGQRSAVLALVDQITRQIKGQLDLTPDQITGDVDRPIAEVSSASLEAQHAYQEGLAQLRQGANQDAAVLLQKATARDPKFAMAFAKLAEALLNGGHYDEATAAVGRAADLADRAALPVAERYQIHATLALAKEDYETAAKSYRELAKLYPADPDIQLSLAKALEQAGKLPEALAIYKGVVQEAPQYGAALLGLGRVQVGTGQPEAAIRSLSDALATKQFDGEPEVLGMIHSILGVAYRDSAQLDKAIEALDRSLAYRVQAGDKKGQAVTLYNLASVYEYRGQVDRALAAERKALGIAREVGDRAEESVALHNMGLTYEASGRLDKALAAYRETLQIEMERQDHRALGNRLNKIANVYRLMGQYDDALVYLEQAKSHLAQSGEKEDRAINLNYFAQVRKAQGLYDQAVEAYLASLPIFKEIGQEMGVAMAHHDLAEIYAAQGRYADARSAFEESLGIYRRLKVVHDVAEVQAPLGHLLATLGQADAADKALAEAESAATEAKAEGILPEVLLGRAELAHLRGQHDAAASLFEQANVKANLSGQKEVAVESRIELGRLYLEQGKLPSAERLLARTREEAAQARLRPLEAEAAVALAKVHLAKKDAEAARRQAQDAVRLAERFSGRPVLQEAYGVLGQSLEGLGRKDEAVDAYAKAARALEFIRGSLRPDDVGTFMSGREVQEFLARVVPRLEQAGRAVEAAPLKAWVRAPGVRS